MKLVQSIMTKNPCYTAGRKITVKGLMLHSVDVRSRIPRCLLKIGIRHLMEQPVYTALLTEMMVRYIRRFRGIIGDGIAHLVQKEAEIIPILGWRCVNLPVSVTQEVPALPARIFRQQELL